MATKNTIIISADPQGVFDEATIDDTSKPGTIMEVVPSSATVGGRFHVRAAATGTSGKQAQQMVLREDSMQGKTVTDAYVSGTRCFLYTPKSGEECNVLVGQGAGTGDTVAVGDKLILYSSLGVLIPTTGSPAETPWEALEAYTQQTNPQLTRCRRL